MTEEIVYPAGPFPADGKDSIAALMREVGIANLSIKIMRKRLEAKYKIDFTSHKAKLQETIDDLMKTREFKKELDKVNKAQQEGLVNAGTKKKAAKEPKVPKEKAEKGEKAVRGKKEKKPDNYPKAAQSAYFLFANDQRAALKEKDPSQSITAVAKAIGELWKAATEDEKAKYAALAEADKKRAATEMEAFLAAGGEQVKRGRSGGKKKEGKVPKKAKKEKDPNAPKRAGTSYMYFINDKRASILASNPSAKVTEVSTIAGKLWKEASEEEKKKYEDLAAADKERYLKECAERGITKKPAKKATKKAAASSSSSSSDSSSSSSDSDSSDSDSSSSSSSDSD